MPEPHKPPPSSAAERVVRDHLQPWWKPVRLELEGCWRYTIGPLSLYLKRSTDQWLLGAEQAEETPDSYDVSSAVLEALPESVSCTRFVFNAAPPAFQLRPRLLDRPIVMKTGQPVKIPPGESITFYISSPVSVSVELLEPHIVLQEFSTLRLSDTWFGPSTREGDMCYAAKTHARNSRSEVPLRPHRAVTPVTIGNRSSELLTIEKLSIPVPFLAVYGLGDGTLWTDAVSLEHLEAGQLAALKIDKELPQGIVAENRLTDARTPVQKGSLVRAFTSIFAG